MEEEEDQITPDPSQESMELGEEVKEGEKDRWLFI